jgi:hypothetical protein
MKSQKQQMRGHAAARPRFDELLASRERMNRVSVDFLKVDLETALTFITIAKQTHDRTRKMRTSGRREKPMTQFLGSLKSWKSGLKTRKYYHVG